MTEPEPSAEEPSAAEIEKALKTILERGDVALGARSRAFLQFIVSESIAGRSSRLKAFTIALAVFGRDASFDPQTNSIVRVEATRLRRWLERYYAGQGAGDPVEIRIPRGGYTPEFVRRPLPAGVKPLVPAQIVPVVPPPSADPPTKTHGWSWRAVAVPVLAAAIAFPLAGFATRWLVPPGPPSRDETPVGAIPPATGGAPGARKPTKPYRPMLAVLLDATGNSGDERRFAMVLTAAIEAALSRFDDLTVLDAPKDVAAARADYLLRGSVMQGGSGKMSLFLRLSRGMGQVIVWTKEIDDLAADVTPAALNGLAGELVMPLAEPYGIIFADLRNDSETARAECFVHFLDPLGARTRDGRSRARQCLGDTLRADPAFVPAIIRLADLDMATYVDGTDARGGRAALADAERGIARAVELMPDSAGVQARLFEISALDGKFADAIRIGQGALARNPLDTDVMGRLGAVYVRNGDLDHGLPLLDKALAGSPAFPAWASAYVSLGAFLRGDAAGARQALLGHDVGGCPIGLLARILAEADADLREKARDVADYKTTFPEFAADPKAAFDRMGFAPAVRDRILDGLKRVGLTPPQVEVRKSSE